jgi:hypothetical protein
LSEELLLTAVAATVAVPAALKFTVRFLHDAVGGVLSITVTTAVPDALLPFTSVAVKVTVLFPLFEHVNDEGDKDSDRIPQASFEPLFISAGTILTLPLPFNATVIFFVITVGAVISFIVTTALQVLEFPLPSVTVKTTDVPVETE